MVFLGSMPYVPSYARSLKTPLISYLRSWTDCLYDKSKGVFYSQRVRHKKLHEKLGRRGKKEKEKEKEKEEKRKKGKNQKEKDGKGGKRKNRKTGKKKGEERRKKQKRKKEKYLNRLRKQKKKQERELEQLELYWAFEKAKIYTQIDSCPF